MLLSELKQFSPLSRRWWQDDFTLLDNNNSPLEPDFFIWLTMDASEKLTRSCKTTLKELQEKANNANLKPSSLPVQANVELDTKTIPFKSYNVVGFIEGSDPVASKECIVYSTPLGWIWH